MYNSQLGNVYADKHRLHDGNNLSANHKLTKQVRTGPIEGRLWLLHYRSNPLILAEENYAKTPHGQGFPEIQKGYAERLRVQQGKMETELFSTNTRSRRIYRQDATADKLPVFTMGSDWYRNVHEDLYWRNGRDRPLFNSTRTYLQ